MHGHRLLRQLRLRGRLDLDAKLSLRRVRVEVARGSPAAGADVREESERADLCEGVGEGEDVGPDRDYWCGLFKLFVVLMLMMVVELVDGKDDLVRSLRRNRWNDEMVIIEEGKDGLMNGAHSYRLCDPESRKARSRKKK